MRGVTFCGEIDTPADLDADGSGSTSRSVRVCPAVERRQCFDLPPAAVEVTEHQLVERECGCGQRTKGTASDGVDAPVQYGPRIAAIIVYAGQFLPEKRTAQALAELFAIPLSSGTVAALTARAAGWPGGFPEEVRARIAGAEWRASTRPGCGPKESSAGCTAPAPASTSSCPATPGGARRR